MNHFNKEIEFEDAIVRYGGLITKICYYFSTDTEEFKDLRQEVLCNIWKGWDKFKNASKISTWIYRISFNTCISFQRKEKKSKGNISIESVLDLAMEEEDPLLKKYDAMHSLIRELNFQDRAVILLWLDEKSYDEIAELMGKNRNAIAVRLKRIKEKLIKMAENYKYL